MADVKQVEGAISYNGFHAPPRGLISLVTDTIASFNDSVFAKRYERP